MPTSSTASSSAAATTCSCSGTACARSERGIGAFLTRPLCSGSRLTPPLPSASLNAEGPCASLSASSFADLSRRKEGGRRVGRGTRAAGRAFLQMPRDECTCTTFTNPLDDWLCCQTLPSHARPPARRAVVESSETHAWAGRESASAQRRPARAAPRPFVGLGLASLVPPALHPPSSSAAALPSPGI